MKPKLKTATVRVEYWDCGNPDHRHKTESVAAACIKKRTSRLPGWPRKWTDEQYAEILAKYRQGQRQCDIASELGLSRGRVQQMIKKAERLERRQALGDQREFLSVRAANCLKGAGLRSAKEVREALANGLNLKEIPFLGEVSFNEIKRWLETAPDDDSF